MGKKKLNCWEFKDCKRVHGAEMDGSSGICLAYMERRLNGVHGGKNAGRACWAIAGTMCNDKVQGSFVFKFKGCSSCDFYKLVKEEEGEKIVAAETLIKKIEDK